MEVSLHEKAVEDSMTESTFDSILQGIDKYLVESMNKYTLAGLAVGVVRDSELVYTKNLGMADITQGKPITSNTVFRIASISKTFTAIGLIQLWEQGRFKLDDPVNEYLKTFEVVHKDPSAPPVTFRQMLTHTSGIGEAPSVLDALMMLVGKDRGFIESEEDRIPLGEFYQGRFQTEVYPDTKWAYANHAFAILGQLVEDISGESFPDYMLKHVFEPLGMLHTDYLFTERVFPEFAQGYNFKKGKFDPIPLKLRLLMGAGSVFSSVNDMARYMAALMNGGANQYGRILKPETLEMMMTSQLDTDPRVFGMGLAFWLEKFGDHLVAGHGGSHPGFISQMKIAPEDKLGVVVFTNTSDLAPEFIAPEILYRLLGISNPINDFPPSGILYAPHDWEALCGFYGPRPGFLTNARFWLTFGGEVEVFVNKERQLAVRSLIGPLAKGMPIYRLDSQDRMLFEGILKGGLMDGYPVKLLFETGEEDQVNSLFIMENRVYKRPFKSSLRFKVYAVLGWLTSMFLLLIFRKKTK
jgi:CubicO group peptidase (beta-lactamase class C family)